jgi:hypothetical protein
MLEIPLRAEAKNKLADSNCPVGAVGRIMALCAPSATGCGVQLSSGISRVAQHQAGRHSDEREADQQDRPGHRALRGSRGQCSMDRGDDASDAESRDDEGEHTLSPLFHTDTSRIEQEDGQDFADLDNGAAQKAQTLHSQ